MRTAPLRVPAQSEDFPHEAVDCADDVHLLEEDIGDGAQVAVPDVSVAADKTHDDEGETSQAVRLTASAVTVVL